MDGARTLVIVSIVFYVCVNQDAFVSLVSLLCKFVDFLSICFLVYRLLL
jgi:hypothetical protein